MDSTLQYLLAKLGEERTRLTEGLADGSAKSFEEYKYTHGVIRGLLTGEAIIQDLAKRMEHDEDE
jgi:hypothetical protein